MSDVPELGAESRRRPGTIESGGVMTIDLVRGAGADALMADGAFARRWAALERACPWATVFQSREFVGTWWSVYRDRYEPLIVVGTEPNGELAGLLALAIDPRSNALVAAGAHHAEYQAWLARESGGEYITRGLARLRTVLGSAALTLTHLPPGTPLGWAASNDVWARRCRVRASARPVVDVGDGSAVEKELQRRKIRYWFRTLERHGPVAFERLTRVEELEEVFDEVIAACDLRQYVHNGTEPFGQDPRKRPLHLALMRNGLLHVTVMRAGSQLVSAQLNWCNRGEVLLGVLAHSPFFARSSPGRLHLLCVARELAREGIATLDLTPGGEPGDYKERFATRHDTVHSLAVLFDRSVRLRVDGRRWLVSAGKGAFARAGIAPARVRALLARQQRLWRGLRSSCVRRELARRLLSKLHRRREVRLYAFDLTRLPVSSGRAAVRRNSLADVLAAFDTPDGALGPRRAYLAEALRRLERGEHVYTRVEGGRLVHFGWLSPQKKEALLADVGQRVRFAEPAALLHDFYTHPARRGRGICQSSLRHVLADAAQIPGARVAYAAAPAQGVAAIRALENVGFTHVGTLYELGWLGTVERWTDLPLEPPSPDTALGRHAGPEELPRPIFRTEASRFSARDDVRWASRTGRSEPDLRL